MKKISFVAIFSVLLLAGCGASRPAGGWPTCECERAVKVPDRTFRTWLVGKGYAEKAGWKRLKPTEEGCRLKEMECFGQGIESLEGIEMFPQLEQLTCSDNPIEELNLNALPHLERLYALNVPLRRLEMDSCHHLKRVQISYTKLAAVDLGDGQSEQSKRKVGRSIHRVTVDIDDLIPLLKSGNGREGIHT